MRGDSRCRGAGGAGGIVWNDRGINGSACVSIVLGHNNAVACSYDCDIISSGGNLGRGVLVERNGCDSHIQSDCLINIGPVCCSDTLSDRGRRSCIDSVCLRIGGDQGDGGARGISCVMGNSNWINCDAGARIGNSRVVGRSARSPSGLRNRSACPSSWGESCFGRDSGDYSGGAYDSGDVCGLC